jgi:hypothetical protein
MATVSRGCLFVEALKQMIFPGCRSDYFWGWRSAMLQVPPDHPARTLHPHLFVQTYREAFTWA